MVYQDKDGKEKIYYFINNLQGTPIFIVDEAGTIIHRQQTDAWGNIEYAYSIFDDEWNYTGKKLDTVTGLYYFNQRWYDPELGRFLTHDPAGQYANPYLYGGNNPLVYIDADGEFAFLVPLFTAALQGGLISAGINVGMQLALTGEINWDSVGQSFCSGALSAGMSWGVGGALGHATSAGNLFDKTLWHGASGGLQSMANGGDFWSGFGGNALSTLTGFAVDGAQGDILGSTLVSGVSGGLGSMLAGGDFGQGFQSGAMRNMFNEFNWNPIGDVLGEEVQNIEKLTKEIAKQTYRHAKLLGGVMVDFTPYLKIGKATKVGIKTVQKVNWGYSQYKDYNKSRFSVSRSIFEFFIPGLSSFREYVGK